MLVQICPLPAALAALCTATIRASARRYSHAKRTREALTSSRRFLLQDTTKKRLRKIILAIHEKVGTSKKCKANPTRTRCADCEHGAEKRHKPTPPPSQLPSLLPKIETLVAPTSRAALLRPDGGFFDLLQVALSFTLSATTLAGCLATPQMLLSNGASLTRIYPGQIPDNPAFRTSSGRRAALRDPSSYFC